MKKDQEISPCSKEKSFVLIGDQVILNRFELYCLKLLRPMGNDLKQVFSTETLVYPTNKGELFPVFSEISSSHKQGEKGGFWSIGIKVDTEKGPVKYCDIFHEDEISFHDPFLKSTLEELFNKVEEHDASLLEKVSCKDLRK